MPRIKAPKLTIAQEIEKRLEDEILQGQIQPGEKLPSEKELFHRYKVSRTVVREAIKMLSSRDLVTIRKGSGVYVNDPNSAHALKHMSMFYQLSFDRKSMLQLMEVRHVIEPAVAGLCAQNRKNEDIRFLQTNVEKFVNRDQSSDLLAELDVQFHSRIAKACGNEILAHILMPIFDQLPRIKTLIVQYVKDKDDTALDYHSRILQAIIAKDSEGATRFMREHLDKAIRDTRFLADAIEKDREN